MHVLRHLTHLTASAVRRLAPAGCACPSLPLPLSDGRERTYLLDDPAACPGLASRHTVYDPRVHLVLLLARQGRDPRWLARFAGLPLPAVERLAPSLTPRRRNAPFPEVSYPCLP
ncbi:hypothetical protein ABZX95_46495 [Streptomyces sp. NPDC004232]|uniref:hypothetical protein n=1 Tax=Streptomyces sp. NPDC004232 TaxID=3154454 RepID=UPI001DB164BF|nr:hypothetical protein [Streptomyces sp. tea 10]